MSGRRTWTVWDPTTGQTSQRTQRTSVDEVQVETESALRQRALHAEIDALRTEVRS